MDLPDCPTPFRTQLAMLAVAAAPFLFAAWVLA